MALSKLKNKLYCLNRNEWVSATPEEIIRQGLLHQLIHEFGFPASCIVVEKGLHQMPHLPLDGCKLPQRRADIVCFGKGQNGSLMPLLLIECKAIKITPKMMSQVIGYNHFLQASFISVVNGEEVITGWWCKQEKKYLFSKRLPHYNRLLSKLQSHASACARASARPFPINFFVEPF